jgi:hypothetical protein
MKRFYAAAVTLALLAGGAAIATAQTSPNDAVRQDLLTARDAIDRALAALDTTTTLSTTTSTSTTSSTTTSSTTAPPPVSDWVEPPIVAVPTLTPGTRPVIPIPGTSLQVRFTADIVARPVGTLQIAYEHATATGQARPNDPLVSPGDGSHDHDFAGIILPDTLPDLALIHQMTPVGDPGSKAAQYGVQHWVDGFGHQPGIWHPSVWLRNGPQLNIGAGSALNYVRDPAAHLDTDRLFLLPDGCGWVSFQTQYHHTGDGKWRVTFNGPTWARRSLLQCGPIGTPEANHDAFWFARSRPPWADSDGIPLAIVSWYFKSGDLKLSTYPTAPELSYGGPATDIVPHMDYVSSSSPIPVLGNIQVGQWLLDATVNAHLFGGESPLYGRFRLETAS